MKFTKWIKLKEAGMNFGEPFPNNDRLTVKPHNMTAHQWEYYQELMNQGYDHKQAYGLAISRVFS